MHWGHYILWIGLFFVGFIVAKKYPGLFSNVPVLNSVTG